MARGIARAPSQHAYRGAAGRTQTQTVHVTGAGGELQPAQIYTAVDALSDPELVEKLHGDALNAIRLDGRDLELAVPVLYHDPAAEVMVLVLADAHRHRELEERIAVLEQLKRDDAAIPAYVKDFAVVFGPDGLRAYLEKRAHEALEAARRGDLANREGELRAIREEHERKGRELERRSVEHDVAKQDLSTRMAELERMRVEVERLRSEARARVIAAAQAQQAPNLAEATVISDPPRTRDDIVTKPVGRQQIESTAQPLPLPPTAGPTHDRPPTPTPLPAPVALPDTGAFDIDLATGETRALPDEGATLSGEATLDVSDEPAAADIIPSGADPLTTETHELPLDLATDPWLDDAMMRIESSITADRNGVRLVLLANDQVARGLRGALDVRVVLHRTPSYAIVALVVGPPPALRVPSPSQLAVVTLDIATEGDRAVLAALGKRFEITADVVARGRRVRRVQLVAPLAENVGYVLRAADDHLRGVAAEGEPRFDVARDAILSPGFDLLGTVHPDAAEFRDDKLAQLETAQSLRRAIAMCRRFARPVREDYLVCTRGFPLPRWRELRRHVLESAVAWGLWMGPELAQVAVSEGLARSRRDLVAKLDRGFENLKRNPDAFDMDGDAVADNQKALAEEARGLGVELKGSGGTGTGERAPAGEPKQRPSSAAMTSEDAPAVAGSIGGTVAGVRISTDELIAQLSDRAHRVAAALQLCDRADPKGAAPVIAAIADMSRAEAVRVLGMATKFGEAAKQPLLEGLASHKAHLRHGSALALAMLRDEDGTQAVIDLLLTEPTEIWREIARAIGQIGPQALMPLASNFGRLGDRALPNAPERVAWAMAHIGVRGGKAAIEAMAKGQSVVAPVARQALALVAHAANDETHARSSANGSQPGRDVTVNRAFSRRFFEAVEQGLPEVGAAELAALDASSPLEMLDDEDLVEDEAVTEEPEAEIEAEIEPLAPVDEELDEADLIQS
ncbi:MAG TPA: hypothetical protein VGM88_27280 [Kofleriaceae bacterium]|jgi:hypothetical protein